MAEFAAHNDARKNLLKCLTEECLPKYPFLNHKKRRTKVNLQKKREREYTSHCPKKRQKPPRLPAEEKLNLKMY